jgi:hypothetical protein
VRDSYDHKGLILRRVDSDNKDLVSSYVGEIVCGLRLEMVLDHGLSFMIETVCVVVR